MIAGILLAAGEGLRFGANKLLHAVDGRPMIHHVLDAAASSRLDILHVVVGHETERARAIIAEFTTSACERTIIVNEGYKSGLMSSLKCGLRAVEPACRAAMVLLADMPYVSAKTIDRIISTFEAHEGFVVATCDGSLTHPRLIPRSHFDRFMALGDDDKGQGVIEAAGFAEVPVTGMSGRDIDQPTDLR